ncbi:MAG: type II secretion system protein GspJ [Pseudomonadota bacterium]
MKGVLRRTSPGLTLIELVVAMGLFALVAVMGVQSLTGTIRISERLGQIDDESAELNAALALLRNDLTAIVPMLFYPPQGAPISGVWQSADGRVIGLALAGQPTVQPKDTNRHYTEWRFDAEAGVLTRRYWPTLLPASADQVTPEMTVLADVTGIDLRSYWPGPGWTDGHFPPVGSVLSSPQQQEDADSAATAPPATYFSALPSAIEITIKTDTWGDIPLVQTLK